MLFDLHLGNAAHLDLDPGGLTEIVDIPWHECAGRALRKTTRAGHAVGILIPLGVSLRDGDVLAREVEGGRRDILLVHVPPCDVWLISPANAHQLAQIALELGNLHVPVEVTATGELVVIPDGPTRQVLDQYRVLYKPAVRVFAPLRATVLQGVKLADGFVVQRGPTGLASAPGGGR
jgi:urease accessory protein UreE